MLTATPPARTAPRRMPATLSVLFTTIRSSTTAGHSSPLSWRRRSNHAQRLMRPAWHLPMLGSSCTPYSTPHVSALYETHTLSCHTFFLVDVMAVLRKLFDAGCITSCKQQLTRDSTAASGVYTMCGRGDSDDYDVFCDMETDGGGWTMVMNSESFGTLSPFQCSHSTTKRC